MFERFKKRNKEKCGIGIVLSGDGFCSGYTSLRDCPEVVTACRRIAELISSMPIMLMENGAGGDTRIFNELSRKIDIYPNQHMTRRTWMEAIVMNLLLYGDGNSVATVRTKDGLLDSIDPVPSSRVAIGTPYQIYIDGIPHDPAELLHFVDNPDPDFPYKGKGLRVILKDVASNLKQAAETKKGFMSSNWKPSIIVKVDALTEGFASKEGRKKLLESYIETTKAGEPWLIPADQFQVEQIRPLSLSDLAIADSVKMDREQVASIIGVPAFLLGAGTWNQKEWNAFINDRVRIIAQSIEQELTRKLILNPKWYLKFNVLSLMDYDLQTVANVFCQLGDRGYVDGNEVRDRIGLSPREGLDELRVLENYIPTDMVGLQKKLVQEDDM